MVALSREKFPFQERQKDIDLRLVAFGQIVATPIKHWYPPGEFCSGFAHDNVVIESGGNIYAVDDSLIVYKKLLSGEWDKVLD